MIIFFPKRRLVWDLIFFSRFVSYEFTTWYCLPHRWDRPSPGAKRRSTWDVVHRRIRPVMQVGDLEHGWLGKVGNSLNKNPWEEILSGRCFGSFITLLLMDYIWKIFFFQKGTVSRLSKKRLLLFFVKEQLLQTVSRECCVFLWHGAAEAFHLKEPLKRSSCCMLKKHFLLKQ